MNYLSDYKLQQNVHRSQNRIESYHQLRAAISQVNGKKQLSGKTDIDVEIASQCGRLIANAITYYNSALLSRLLEKYQQNNNQEAIEKLLKISPVAWQHIHLLGHYTFCSNKNPIDLDKIILNFYEESNINCTCLNTNHSRKLRRFRHTTPNSSEALSPSPRRANAITT